MTSLENNFKVYFLFEDIFMYKQYFCYILLFVLQIFVGSVCIFADVAIDDVTTKKCEFVFHSMDDTRMRWHSGICHVHGQTTRLHNDGKKNIITEENTIIFDYEKEYYYFERVDRHRDNKCYRSLRTSDYYYEAWLPIADYADPTLAGIKRQPIAERKETSLAAPFDIQMLGYITLSSGYYCYTYRPDSRSSYLQNQRAKLLNEKPISYQELSNGLILIDTKREAIDSSLPSMKRRYWISPKQGYALIKLELADKLDAEFSKTIEMSWTKINDVWVPTTINIISPDSHVAEWSIDWKMLNEKIPDRYFDPKWLSDKPVNLFSDELEKTLHIGSIGSGKDNISATKHPTAKNDYSILNYFLIIIGLVVMLVAFIKMVYDRWEKKKQT
jgi:hypothetical protein